MPGRRLESAEHLVGIQPPIASDVGDGGAALSKRPRHPDTPMAFGRVLLGAEDGDGVALCCFQQPCEPLLELWCCRHALVGGETVLKRCDLAKLSSTELLPHEEVLEPGFRYDRLEVLAVELVGEPRVRLRTDVGEDLYAVLTQQRQEPLDRMVRVANGEQPGHGEWLDGAGGRGG
jgi:hypothetical protein